MRLLRSFSSDVAGRCTIIGLRPGGYRSAELPREDAAAVLLDGLTPAYASIGPRPHEDGAANVSRPSRIEDRNSGDRSLSIREVSTRPELELSKILTSERDAVATDARTPSRRSSLGCCANTSGGLSFEAMPRHADR